MDEGAKQANEDMWRRQMLAELVAIKNALQKEEPKPDSLQQLKAEIALTIGSIARDSSIPPVDRLDKIVMFVNEQPSAV